MSVWKREDMTRIINECRRANISADRIIFHKDGKHYTILTELDPATIDVAPGPHYVKTIDVSPIKDIKALPSGEAKP